MAYCDVLLQAPTLWDRLSGAEKPFPNLPAGIYSVVEDDPFGGGTTLISCDDDASSVPSTKDDSTRTANINLEAGETVTCTFTNTDVTVDDGTVADDNASDDDGDDCCSVNNGSNDGESGDNPQAGTGGDPVILRTGELVLSATDLIIPGRGFDFRVKRSYRSQYNFNGPLGHNWEFNHGERLLLPLPGDPVQRVLVVDGGGRVDGYVRNPDGSFSSPDGFYDILRQNRDGSFTIRDRYGFRRNFDENGRLVSRVDRNGNTMSYSYDSQGRLSVVTDTMGRDINFTFDNQDRLVAITDFIGRQIRYTYDDWGDLVAVRSPVVAGTSTGNDFPDGKTTLYEYSSRYSRTDVSLDPDLAFANHNLVSITDPKGQRYLVNTYGQNPGSYEYDRVVEQQFGDLDQVYTFAYEELNPGETEITPDLPRNETVEIDRNGNRTVHIHNVLGNLLEERVETNRDVNSADPDVFVTRHTYNADGERLSTTYPEGNQVEYTYDDNQDRHQQGNLIAITGFPGPRDGAQSQIRVTLQYEPFYNQLLVETGPRGNDPSFVPQNGGEASAERYTTLNFFDYQEGDNLDSLAAEMGRSSAEIATLLSDADMELNLGDRNGDGISDRISGNVVRREMPTVSLPVDSAQADIEGDPSQEIVWTYTYNRFGQMTSEVDPEGNVDVYLFFPENDPDGDQIPSVSSRALAEDTGGYRSALVRDSRASARRSSAAPLTQIRNEWFYDPVGNVILTVDGRGNPTSYERNALNQVVRVISEPPFNYERLTFYDANDNVTRREVQNTDTNGPGLDEFLSHTYEYDILDNPISKSEEVSTEEILTTRYEYDQNENRVRITQPEGNVVALVFHERDLVFIATRGFGSPEASTRTMTYDGNRNLIRLVDGADNNGDGESEETLYLYDGYDRQVGSVDAVGNQMTYSHDPASNVVREQWFGPDGGASPADNSGDGNVLQADRGILFDELSRVFQQDALLFANIGAVGPEGPLTLGDGMVTSRYEHDRNSRLTRTLDDNVHQRLLEYDGVNRVIHGADELGNEIIYSYDDNHNLIETLEVERSPAGLVTEETFKTTFEYDSIDRLTSLVDNLGNRTGYSYDSRGNLIGAEDQLGNTTAHVYDGINRKLKDITDLREGGTGAGQVIFNSPVNPDGSLKGGYDWDGDNVGRITKSYGWDGNSRLVSLTDDNGNLTGYGSDSLNRLIVDTFADGSTNTYVYDGDDNVVTFTDENGTIHENQFDGINRLTGKNVVRAPGVSGSSQWRFEYDGLSRRTKATDNNNPSTPADDSVVELQYDSLSRLLEEVQNGQRIESAYDGVGNRLSLVYPNGRVVGTTYDALDRIDTIRNQGSAAMVAEYDYIGPRRTLERRYGNGTRLSYHDGAGQDVGYDGIRRVVERRHETANGDPVAGFAYAYDQEDNRRFERDLVTDQADVYEYDSYYRLTRAAYQIPGSSVDGILSNGTTNADVASLEGLSETSYQLDGVGNWSERTVDGATTSFTDNEMNEYASVGAIGQTHDDNGNLTTDGSQRYSYDFANRLVRVTDATGLTTARYAYDALGRRTLKVVGDSVTSFFYDGARSIEERNGEGSVTSQYVFGRGIDEVLELTTEGRSYFYHDNSIGPVVALTDETGAVVERYRYQAYGENTILAADAVTPLPDSTVGNPFRFTGRRFDNESGLYYYRARHYLPSRGRFLQRDPKGYVDGLGLYQYLGSNPINFVDPWGLTTKGDDTSHDFDIKKFFSAFPPEVEIGEPLGEWSDLEAPGMTQYEAPRMTQYSESELRSYFDLEREGSQQEGTIELEGMTYTIEFDSIPTGVTTRWGSGYNLSVPESDDGPQDGSPSIEWTSTEPHQDTIFSELANPTGSSFEWRSTKPKPESILSELPPFKPYVPQPYVP